MAELAIIHYSNATAGDSYLGYDWNRALSVFCYFRFYLINNTLEYVYVLRSRVWIQCTDPCIRNDTIIHVQGTWTEVGLSVTAPLPVRHGPSLLDPAAAPFLLAALVRSSPPMKKIRIIFKKEKKWPNKKYIYADPGHRQRISLPSSCLLVPRTACKWLRGRRGWEGRCLTAKRHPTRRSFSWSPWIRAGH